ncbi:MAG: hypothetical protein WC359_15120 [Dehalococcoidia bacterium]|jgi:hypothetical protein
MPYTITIYPDEKLATPHIGQLFVVTEVGDATDMHWGACVVSRLTPLALDAASSGNDDDQERDAAQVKLVR